MSLKSIPYEILNLICAQLSGSTLKAVAKTCKRLSDAAKDNGIWKPYVCDRFSRECLNIPSDLTYFEYYAKLVGGYKFYTLITQTYTRIKFLKITTNDELKQYIRDMSELTNNITIVCTDAHNNIFWFFDKQTREYHSSRVSHITKIYLINDWLLANTFRNLDKYAKESESQVLITIAQRRIKSYELRLVCLNTSVLYYRCILFSVTPLANHTRCMHRNHQPFHTYDTLPCRISYMLTNR